MSTTQRLLAQLDRCAKQFRYYEQQHLAKRTPESDAKAKVNCDLAAECEALIGEVRQDLKEPQ